MTEEEMTEITQAPGMILAYAPPSLKKRAVDDDVVVPKRTLLATFEIGRLEPAWVTWFTLVWLPPTKLL